MNRPNEAVIELCRDEAEDLARLLERLDDVLRQCRPATATELAGYLLPSQPASRGAAACADWVGQIVTSLHRAMRTAHTSHQNGDCR